MKALNRIRKAIQENEDSIYFGGMEKTADTLRNLSLHGEAERVFDETEDRGDRWTKWEITVYKVTAENEVAYFQVEKEVGATENQSDGSVVVKEVIAKEITTTIYVSKPEPTG